MILSASGWRKIFAADGDQESRTELVSPQDLALAAAAAFSFAELLYEKSDTGRPRAAVAVDTRPTGPALADIVCRVLLLRSIEPYYLFISPAPEIMAYVKTRKDIDGFFYISASHNPIGHNGFKFGFSNGAVAGGEESRRAIDIFRSLVEEGSFLGELSPLLSRPKTGAYTTYPSVLESIGGRKADASAAYEDFTMTVAAGSSDPQKRKTFFRSLRTGIRRSPLGIAAELNGSARTRSIDGNFLGRMGIRFRSINELPRKIVHPIVPEGENLDTAKDFLRDLHREDPSFLLAYVPDNDGDRGNIVYVDEEASVKAVEAQAVFALSVLSELADLRLRSGNNVKAAVVINGPTSMRIAEIAETLNVEVFRTETGEANVVCRAEELRRDGYTVRILGEGSNGGNITHPATVRDPLNTLLSLIKLLRPDGEGPFSLWCRLCGKAAPRGKNLGLSALLESLPSYITTGAYEEEAKMRVRNTRHDLLKKRYEEIFLRQWERRREELHDTYGILDFREENYEDGRTVVGFGPDFRSGEEKGGLKIVFSDREKRDSDFIWMRGSGTEPVFRVLADCRGEDRRRHDDLLAWHRAMIEEADNNIEEEEK